MKDQLRFALFRRRALRRAGAIIESGAYCDPQTILGGKNRVCSGSKLIATNLGYGSYVGEHCSLVRTTVGNYSCIGPRVESVLGSHPVSGFASIHPAFFSTRAQAGFTYASEDRFPEFGERSFTEAGHLVFVGSDAWIGHGARIMQGVRIDDGAVVAAGSIVTKDVDPFTIVAGVPAKPLRTRFTPEIVRRLLQAAWWNRTPEELRRLAPAFSNVERLLEALESNSGPS